MDIEKYQKIIKEAERSARDRDQATGALKQLTKELKEEFQCENVKEAKELLEKMTKELGERTKKFDSDVSLFERKWKNVL